LNSKQIGIGLGKFTKSPPSIPIFWQILFASDLIFADASCIVDFAASNFCLTPVIVAEKIFCARSDAASITADTNHFVAVATIINR